MSNITIDNIQSIEPSVDELKTQYDQWIRRIDQSTSDVAACMREWDDTRRKIGDWQTMVNLRFNQDTTNESYQADRKRCDELRPQLVELEVAMKRRLLRDDARPSVEEEYGSHVTRMWEVDIVTYDPVIADDLVKEAELEARYNELLASAEFEFQGETCNHSAIVKYLESPDREIRRQADQLRWQWFADHRAELDDLFDQLVHVRHGMALKLGFDDFVQLGYQRMLRIDYDRHDVQQCRDAVREFVVPLSVKLLNRQAERLGLAPDEMKHWDEFVYDAQGNPKPQGGHDQLIDQAQAMFDAMGHGLGEFFQLMQDASLMDLKIRPGKAGGGFCTSFESYGLPFIFANFNGTKGDVEVFTHEMGHAFQCYMSRNQPITDYLWPTYESCEIHSMSLEFLTYPHMSRFFGDDAERFRTIHLSQSLLFLPYGVAVDHFQHLVYSQPDASPEDRFRFWQEMEQRYLPWRDYGPTPHPASGGRWQLQRHIYLSPFYYIDYTLAQACALQFWLQVMQQSDGMMDRYVALCERGGEAPFQDLARSAGLRSPFDGDCLRDVVQEAETTLLS